MGSVLVYAVYREVDRPVAEEVGVVRASDWNPYTDEVGVPDVLVFVAGVGEPRSHGAFRQLFGVEFLTVLHGGRRS